MPITIPKTYMDKHLEHAVCKCSAFGHSKRSDKFNDDINTDWKLYSDAYKRDMVDLALDFGRFLTKNYPNIRNSYEVGRSEVQAFMDKKASTCAPTTLTTKISRLWKLEKCCMRISCSKNQKKFNWDTSNIIMPKSTKDDAYKKNKPIPMEVAKVAIADLSEKKSEAVNTVTLSLYTGMRVEEDTCLKVKNVHFEKGEFGFGYVVIVDGPEGGAKGGRPRIIPFLSAEARDAVKAIVAGKKPDDYIVENLKDGTKLTPTHVGRMLREALKPRHGNTYLYIGYHGLRKTFAQQYYDKVRKYCSKKEAISKTNMVLGHGKNRGEEALATYVANRH